jgi:hypothetical protein
LNAACENFVDEVRGISDFAPLADELERALLMTFAEGDTSADALELNDGLTWILRQRQRSVEERLIAIDKLLSLRGKVFLPSLRKFLGW